jgi:hypothetical protein
MTADLSPFCFSVGTLGLDPAEDLIAKVPAGLNSREALFEALRRELLLPDYFGGNWDALSECVRDFHWVARRRIVVLHEDLPLLDAPAVATYVDILSGAVEFWRADRGHEFIVTFPARLAPN